MNPRTNKKIPPLFYKIRKLKWILVQYGNLLNYSCGEPPIEYSISKTDQETKWLLVCKTDDEHTLGEFGTLTEAKEFAQRHLSEQLKPFLIRVNL